jgi:HK97 family phage major capsid protein
MDELLKKLQELTSQIDAILNAVKLEKRGLSADEKTKIDELEKEYDNVEDIIERLKKADARKKELRQSVTDPVQIQVTRESDHNEDGEYRGYKEFSKGGFGEYLRDVIRFDKGLGKSDKLVALESSVKAQIRLAASGMNEGTGTDGGFLTQSDHAMYMQDEIYNSHDFLKDCLIVDTDKPELVANFVDETSRATGSRYGGVQAYRRPEAGSISATKPQLRRETISAPAMDALYYATEEILEDVAGLQTLVAPMFVKELAWKLLDEVIGGSGASGQCHGILNSPALISIAKEGSQTADTIVYNNVDKMNDRLLVGSEGRAKWYVHADAPYQLRNMLKIGSNTDFLVYQTAGGISGKPYDTLFGKEVRRLEQCRALGDLGDIILADFAHYLLLRRKGIVASESAHVRFLFAEKAIRWTQRVGGQGMPSSALTDAYGNTTRSPFVTLAERA